MSRKFLVRVILFLCLCFVLCLLEDEQRFGLGVFDRAEYVVYLGPQFRILCSVLVRFRLSNRLFCA